MKKILTVWTAWLVLCPLVEARQGSPATGSDSHRSAAREFIEASGARQNGAENFQSAMSGALANMPADRAAIQERFLPRMAEALAEITESDEFLESMVDGYVEVFTEEELRSLTAMFSSPIGRTYVERMPAMAQAAAAGYAPDDGNLSGDRPGNGPGAASRRPRRASRTAR